MFGGLRYIVWGISHLSIKEIFNILFPRLMILSEVYCIIYFKINIFVYSYKLFVRAEVHYICIIFIFIIFSIVKLCESTKD